MSEMIMEEIEILEGWKQIADFLRYSESHLRRLFKNFPVPLEHWRGPGHRIKMTPSEARAFEKKYRLKRE